MHTGDPIKHNHALYDELPSQFDIIRPSLDELQREPFMRALKEGKWSSFHAILRPFWNTGGEMGQWDRELISLLPTSVKVFASAGAGYNWAECRRACGTRYVFSAIDSLSKTNHM